MFTKTFFHLIPYAFFYELTQDKVFKLLYKS